MIDYKEYLKENLNKPIVYSEYLAGKSSLVDELVRREQIDRNISYTEYLSAYDTKNYKRKIKIKNLFN
jgi:hypothetical protein